VINSIDIFSAADSVDSAKARQQGLAFIDGSIPGYALLIGSDVAQALPILESLTQRQIVVFVTEDALQNTLQETGVSLGWDSGIVPLQMTKALGCIARVAQTFGNTDEPDDVLRYARERLFGFTILLGEATPEHLGLAEAALSFGCPLLSNAQLPLSVENWKVSPDYHAAIGGVELHDIVQIGIEERGLKIQVPLPELPVAYSTDFSGQTVRDDSCGACFTGVELVVTGEDVVDGRITLTGLDLEAAAKGNQPYAMMVEVSGREMQSDFEPVLEKQIETIFNDMDGIMHRGQRQMVTLRIAQKSIDKGLSLRHLGEVLHARLHNEFGNILSRVQISTTTDPAQIQAIQERAQAIYEKRDKRLESLVDEDVDTFYTCNQCQTIAAGHLCVISPERPGACGAVDWMDARAAVSIQPVGSNKAVKKEGLLDARLGQWESVNQIARQESGSAITAYSLYSLMQDPGSACGDFECITAMLPLSNGVMVIEHTYKGMTPSGMDWAMLYEMVGAGVPTPGFLGHSKRALGTQKFISAEGGWQRIVWMNHALREELRSVLEALAAEAGVPGFVDMISTEQNAVSEEEILLYLKSVGHPALMMEPMM
jgi:acetyl-CoA synthase